MRTRRIISCPGQEFRLWKTASILFAHNQIVNQFCTDEKNAGRIEHPQQKHNKGRKGPVDGAEFHYGSDIPGKNMLGKFEEYCCKQRADECVGRPDFHFREENVQNGDREKYHQERDDITYHERRYQADPQFGKDLLDGLEKRDE